MKLCLKEQSYFGFFNQLAQYLLQAGALLINPDGRDRKTLRPEDLVWVKGDAADGMPDGTLRLHQRIYEDHPEVQSVITAQSPAIMAHAVTGEAFDSHTVSEGFIILHGLQSKTWSKVQGPGSGLQSVH